MKTEKTPLKFWNNLHLFTNCNQKTFFGCPFWIFPKNRKWIFDPYIFQYWLLFKPNICSWNLENVSITSRVISEKPSFQRSFWIFTTKPEEDFSNLYFLLITSIVPKNLPIENLKIFKLVLELSAKKLFLAAILNFYDQTGSRFFKSIFFTNHYYWT